MTETPANPYADFPPALQIHLNDFRADVDTLMDELESGDIEPYEWRDRFADLLTVYVSTGYAAGAREQGRKGKPKRGSKAWIWLAAWVALQLDFLDGFTKAVRDGRESGVDIPGTWNNRARMYVTAAVAPYWYGVTEGLPIPAIPGDGSSQCGQNDRCHLKIDWLDKKKGDADVIWVLEPGVIHCQTCEVRAEKWNPLVIRGWKLEIPVSAKESETHKHLTGQHDQSRHAWRYSTDAVAQRGPKEDDFAGVDAYQRRAARKVSYSTEQIHSAHETMARAAQDYIRDMAPYYPDQQHLSDAVAGYDSARQQLQEKSRIWEKETGALRRKISEKRAQAEDASERYRETGDERWKRKRAALDAQIQELRAKVNGKKFNDMLMDVADLEIEKKNREKDMVDAAQSLANKHEARVEAATDRYLRATEGARGVLLSHYGAQAETLRRKAVTRADRLERAARSNTKKAEDYRRQADRLFDEVEARSDIPSASADPRVMALYHKSKEHYALAARQRERANAVFGEELRQAGGRLRTKDFDAVSPTTRALRKEGMDDFAALAGRNPFLERYRVNFVADRASFARASFSQFTLSLEDIGRKNRGTKILDVEKREFRSAVVHEMGHALEAADPCIRIEALNFFRRRTASDTPVPLYGEMKIGGLDLTEYTFRDRFVDTYMGKVYNRTRSRPEAAQVMRFNKSWGEITSTGLEYLFKNPLKLARQDPEMFRFLFALLRLQG